MAITLSCRECRTTFRTPPLAAGSVIHCPACRAALAVPELPFAQPVPDGDATWPTGPPPATPAAPDWAAAPPLPLPEWASRRPARSPFRLTLSLVNVLLVLVILVVCGAIAVPVASVLIVAALQVQKENKADTAKVQAISLDTALKRYMLDHDGGPPPDLRDTLPYLGGRMRAG